MAGFRIPASGLRIPYAWIPDSKVKNMSDFGFRIHYLGRHENPIHGKRSHRRLLEIGNWLLELVIQPKYVTPCLSKFILIVGSQCYTCG